jgi:hypothetical protein
LRPSRRYAAPEEISNEREQKMSMPACAFTFEDSPAFEGFAHGSTWNGFDNVAVTGETLEKIIAWFEAEGCDTDTVDSFRSIEPMTENNLYSLGFGFATRIVDVDEEFARTGRG